MGSLRNRRGVIAIFTVLLFLAMLTIIAVVVDFARMQFMRNQMQTSADAAALAGAVQLIGTQKSDYLTQAQNYAAANKLMGSTITLDDSDVVLGKWSSPARVFTGPASLTTADAVQVTVRHSTSYLLANVLGWAPKQIAVRSVAWAGPSVSQTQCMKPWAMPFEVLRDSINAYLGQSIPPSDGIRDPEDIDALKQMTEAQRTFSMKITSQGQADLSGDFYAVDLPSYYVAATNSYNQNIPSGSPPYEDAIEGVDSNGNPVCFTVGVGDTLRTEPGNKVGPTNKAVTDSQHGLCTTLTGSGGCFDANGNHPVVKSAFYTGGGGGRTYVNVAVIGSFELTGWVKQQGNLYVLQGVFVPLKDSGPVGTGNTTLQKIVLVK
ncbi:MAG: TadG family pilus assembly protein [Gemmatimonadaceae bacterium]